MKRISIGSWAYTIGPYAKNPIPWATVCSQLKEFGFDGVELGGFAPHPNPDDLPTRESRAKVVADLKQVGLGLSALAANLWGERLLDTEDTTPYEAAFLKNADFCVDLGIPVIRVDCVQPPTIFRTVDREAAFRRLIACWARCARVAAERGLVMSWEFEPGFAFNKPREIVRVLDAIPADNFGVMYDTSHGHMVAVVGARHEDEQETLPGGQLELIRLLDGRINHIHLIDSDGTCHKGADGEDETSTHAPFGSGVVDFDRVVPALARQKLAHDWWTIDLCFWADAWPVTQACKTAIDRLNRAYGGAAAARA
jgi:sugar phosphate isomerase/epimerase